MSKLAHPGRRRIASGLLMYALIASSAAAETPPAVGASLDRATVIRLAVEKSPDVRAASERARAVLAEAQAEGSLPPPEAMVQVWQIPLARPYAVQDSQMIMLGIGQTFPAPGARGAREAAKRESARAEEAIGGIRARDVAREAGHAFTDYVEAIAHHRIHRAHRELARRTLAIARARHAAAGALTDVTSAELDLAKTTADVVTDAARTRTATARINTLLAREPAAPLGDPADEEASTAAWSTTELLAEARRLRPELRGAEAERAARKEELRATDREATWPSFSVAALYFAPTTPNPTHGYGFNATVSLPWLWGPQTKKVDAGRHRIAAATSTIQGIELRIATEVATAEATLRAAGLRFQVVRDRVLPASERAYQAAWAGYESGRTDILTLLIAQRAIIDAREEIATSRAILDHALAELDSAVSVAVPRRPLGAFVDLGPEDHP